MTPEQQRIKIAEACGWKDCFHVVAINRWYGTAPEQYPGNSVLPDYLNDLNAMHEAVATKFTTPLMLSEWEYQLRGILANGAPTFEVAGYELAQATSAQRAEAFCVALVPRNPRANQMNEHLDRIRARCVELLALAEKRTPGPWWWRMEPYDNILRPYADLLANQRVVLAPRHDGNFGSELRSTPEDRAYIAACAGTAEAGWRSTLAAIDALRQLETDPAIPELFRTQHAFALTMHILAAWPEESL